MLIIIKKFYYIDHKVKASDWANVCVCVRANSTKSSSELYIGNTRRGNRNALCRNDIFYVALHVNFILWIEQRINAFQGCANGIADRGHMYTL